MNLCDNLDIFSSLQKSSLAREVGGLLTMTISSKLFLPQLIKYLV